MPYCPECGAQVRQNAKFCSSCGISLIEDFDSSERKVEYAGVVRKCPSCGAPVNSFTAICPECGYELTSTHINPTIKEFTEQLKICDQEIANESTPKLPGGYSTWSKNGKTWWVIANIFLACWPLIIYWIVRAVKSSKLKFTPGQVKKAAFVNNFTFPNNREVIIEALIIIAQRMSILSAEGINGLTEYWEKIWYRKAVQLYQKSEFSMANDQTASKAFKEIQSIDKEFKKSKMIKTIVIILAIAVFFFWGSIRNNRSSNTVNNTYNYHTENTVNNTGR